MTQKNIQDIYPLSPMQQGLLFHATYDPESRMYFEHSGCTFEGELDLTAFRRAWQRVVDRHPTLRTAFAWERADRPLQVVLRQAELPWEEHDWRGLPADEQGRRLAQLLREDRARGFDIARAPLLRVSIIRLGELRHRFVLSLHHVLLDGWCQSLILREVFAFYAAFCRGEELDLPQPRPYRDYIVWLRQQDLGQAEAFWRRTLRGFSAPTLLRGEGQAERVPGPDDYENRGVELSGEASAALQRLAREQQLTLNTILQGAWALLLHHYCAADDVVFGSVVSGRPADLAGSEAMIGYFANTLPVRVRVEPQRPCADWLRALQARQIEARQFEYTPLVQVQSWSELPPGVPLFESLLAFENYPVDAALADSGVSALAVSELYSAERTNYPVVVIGGLERGRLWVRLISHAGYLPDGAAPRVLGHLQALLEGIAAAPQRRLADLSPLGADERRTLLGDWNATAADFPRELGLAQLFERQAARTPDAPAVSCGQTRWSYRELDARASRLADQLARQGAGPEAVVPLLSERGSDFLAAMLGIFKAGAAYLPLDPRYPVRRMAQILGQSGARLLLVSQEFAAAARDAVAAVRAEQRPAVLVIEELLAEQAADARFRAVPTHPHSLAYVIFTSGSTGQPKGAIVEQAGMVNHLYAKLTELGLGPHDTLAQNAAQSFDISVWQFLAALLVGGRVHIVEDEVALDAQQLLAEAARESVTVLELVPSLLRVLLDVVERAPERAPALPGLRWLLLTGEALPPDLCRRWLARYPRTPMLNAYGPSECSDDVTHHRVAEPPPESALGVPIGRPVANMRMYVLDRLLRPTPLGVPGELYVGGVGVGRGYLGRPDLTAERFVPDPFATTDDRRQTTAGDHRRDAEDAEEQEANESAAPAPSRVTADAPTTTAGDYHGDAEDAEEPHKISAFSASLRCNTGGRLYRTGDLVRYREDGALEFLGRLDHQVKVRGFRIELSEIEAVLRQHPAVDDVVVADQDSPAGYRELVAYVVPRLPASADAGATGADYLGQWRGVFDQIYTLTGDAPPREDAAVVLRSWIDSYTSDSYPEEAIFEVIETTVERIAALRPTRVLEIGCGTGLLLSRVAPGCQEYWGTDFSAEAIEALRARLASQPAGQARVELRHAEANDFAGLPAGHFDTVVINDVIQYFPDASYLLAVIAGALGLLAPGGRLFVGSIRSLPLLELFHSSVQLARAPADLPAAELRQRVRQHVAQERELLVDPRFFSALRGRLPRVSHVQAQVKGGQLVNEFTRFRYDVVLYVEAQADLPQGWVELGCPAGQDDVGALRQLLERERPEAVRVRRVPNGRLAQDVRAAALLAGEADATAGELRTASAAARGVAPSEFWALGDALGYRALVMWSGDGSDGHCDVILRRAADGSHARPCYEDAPAEGAPEQYAGAPLRGLLAQRLIPELREFLEARLPEYMVPAAFVTLDRLPLTPNGKVDRRSLPATRGVRPALAASYVAPSGPTEQTIARVWAAVLDLAQVGANDNFFKLGGHSLHATQVIIRINEALGLSLPVRVLFLLPTVRELAASIDKAQASAAAPDADQRIAELRARIQRLKDAQGQ